ncbi:MAG: antitoxin Xre/MbcA/ParS toxin-binding domain-containing protein [Bacteroidia bacterium]
MGKQLAKRKPVAKAIALKKQTDVFTIIGLNKFLSPDEINSFKIIDVIRKGLPMGILNKLAMLMSFKPKDVAPIINVSERTLQRYVPSKLLDKETSLKTIQLASLYENGVQLFGSVERFNEWMNAEILALGQKKPIEFIDTSVGINEVQKILVRIQHGVYS